MKYRHPMFLETTDSILVIVDIQDKLYNTMDAVLKENMLKNVPILVEAANELGIPVIVSEQYPKGIGPTIEPIKSRIKTADYIEKVDFAATEVADFTSLLAKYNKNQVILVGMETHICVYQTALGLLKLGYDVHVVKDAVASRINSNFETGIELMTEAGALASSTETVLFQLLKKAGTDSFKKLQKLII